MVMSGTVSFDVDGVLANFTRGFTRIGNKLFGTPVGNEGNQQTWEFEEFPELQLTKERCKAMWEVVRTDVSFWKMLDPLNVSVMPEIDEIANKVFITNRVGIDPGGQTRQFLRAWGVCDSKVFVAADKVPIAKELNVVAHIDDYPPNCVQLKTALPEAYIALLWTSYNKESQEECRKLGIEIVLSVEQFIDEAYCRGLIER